MIRKNTLAKEIDGAIDYIYPKTSADVVIYDETHTVKDEIDELKNSYIKKDGNKVLSDNNFSYEYISKLEKAYNSIGQTIVSDTIIPGSSDAVSSIAVINYTTGKYNQMTEYVNDKIDELNTDINNISTVTVPNINNRIDNLDNQIYTANENITEQYNELNSKIGDMETTIANSSAYFENGVLSISNGGTGVSSLPSGVLIGNGTNAITARGIDSVLGSSSNLITSGAVNTALNSAINNHTHNYAGSSSAGGAATKAIGDQDGNTIKSSYASSISISGNIITLKSKSGTNLGSVIIPDNSITYSASDGIKLDGTTFKHSNSLGSSGTAGSSTNTSGSTISIPYINYDAQGHITSDGYHTHTIGSLNTSVLTAGTLSVARGGTGKTTFTSGEVLIGNGTGAIATKAIDSTVTSNSTNLITSGAVYSKTNSLNTSINNLTNSAKSYFSSASSIDNGIRLTNSNGNTDIIYNINNYYDNTSSSTTSVRTITIPNLELKEGTIINVNLTNGKSCAVYSDYGWSVSTSSNHLQFKINSTTVDVLDANYNKIYNMPVGIYSFIYKEVDGSFKWIAKDFYQEKTFMSKNKVRNGIVYLQDSVKYTYPVYSSNIINGTRPLHRMDKISDPWQHVNTTFKNVTFGVSSSSGSAFSDLWTNLIFNDCGFSYDSDNSNSLIDYYGILQAEFNRCIIDYTAKYMNSNAIFNMYDENKVRNSLQYLNLNDCYININSDSRCDIIYIDNWKESNIIINNCTLSSKFSTASDDRSVFDRLIAPGSMCNYVNLTITNSTIKNLDIDLYENMDGNITFENCIFDNVNISGLVTVGGSGTSRSDRSGELYFKINNCSFINCNRDDNSANNPSIVIDAKSFVFTSNHISSNIFMNDESEYSAINNNTCSGTFSYRCKNAIISGNCFNGLTTRSSSSTYTKSGNRT